MKFDPMKARPIGASIMEVDFYRIFAKVYRFSSTLKSLLLNFVDLNWIRDRDDFIFNSDRLEMASLLLAIT